MKNPSSHSSAEEPNQRLRRRSIQGIHYVHGIIHDLEEKQDRKNGMLIEHLKGVVDIMSKINEFLVRHDPEIEEIYQEIESSLDRIANSMRSKISSAFLREVCIEESNKLNTLFNDQKKR